MNNLWPTLNLLNNKQLMNTELCVCVGGGQIKCTCESMYEVHTEWKPGYVDKLTGFIGFIQCPWHGRANNCEFSVHPAVNGDPLLVSSLWTLTTLQYI